ncbi:diguanylate cyclase [Vibrio kanaloae]|uniref:sensor domain-containing diguanylate cyclase n=1 Tax=Vibrio kanaloae TaxID=170673 RepID=UPI00354B3B79
MQASLDIIAQLKKENAELKRHNTRLQEKLNAALDSNGLCLWEHHIPSGKLTIFNMDWGKMLGYQPHELNATFETWKNNLHPDDYHQALKAFEDHFTGNTDLYEVVYRMTHKDGSDSYVYDRGRTVEFDTNGTPIRVMGTHIDITKEKRFEQQLAILASTDKLTGLLNRQSIEKHFNEMKRSNTLQKAAMIFIDIDNFKAVNDTLGHQTGDRILSFIAERFVSFASEQAQIGRIGGDEFVVLYPNTEQKEVMFFCDELLKTVVPESNQMLTGVTIGMSIGVCLFNQGEYHFDEVYHQSDLAMYHIKKDGKNGIKILYL